MALPLTRDITAVPGAQIPSNLANNLQDMIVGGKSGSHDIHVGLGLLESEGWFAVEGVSGRGLQSSPSKTQLAIPVPIPVGGAVTAFTVYLDQTSITPIQAFLRSKNMISLSEPDLVGPISTPASVGLHQLSASGFTHTSSPDVRLYIFLQVGNVGDRIYGARLTVQNT